MSKILYISLSLFLLPLLGIAEELNLSVNGKTDYQIVIPDNADARNNFAAEQLKEYLKKITKADFKIAKIAQATSTNKIYVGLTKEMINFLPEVDFKADDSSRIIIKTKGSNLFITGTQSSGTLLAVYSFLEDYLGCRWLTASTSVIPADMNLTVADINLDYTPPFKLARLVAYVGTQMNYVYAARLRLKTLSFYEKPIHKVLNKTFNTWPPYHSSFTMIPPEKYFPTHPEWFSLNRGKRTDNHQLCFSSDANGLAQEMLKNAKSYLDKNPSGTVMVGQMDMLKYSRCACKKCFAIEQEEGSMSGPQLRFINKLADLVSQDYPKGKVMTFAYQYTEKPPKLVKPRDNVVILLCSYGYEPFEKLNNSDFKNTIEGWSKITKNIIVWTYPAPFGHFVSVFPNLYNTADDIRFLSQYNVKGIFVQGDVQCPVGDFVELRAYLFSHLVWNPNLDTKTLIKEFLDNYYGKAGKYISQYLDIINNSNIATGDNIFIPLDVSIKCANLYKEALEAVDGNKELTNRVLKVRLSFVDNTIGNALVDSKYSESLKILGFNNIDEAITHLGVIFKKNGASRYAENSKPVSELLTKYRNAIAAKSAKAPSIPMVNLNNKFYFDMQEFSLGMARSRIAKVIEDPKASNGSTVALQGGDYGWHIFATLSKAMLAYHKTEKVTMYASAKVVFTGNKIPQDEPMFTLGVYNKRSKRTLSRTIKHKDIKRENSYNYYSFSFTIDDNDKMWLGDIGDKKYIKEVLFDRIVVVKE
jgi:hypothetical protein